MSGPVLSEAARTFGAMVSDEHDGVPLDAALGVLWGKSDAGGQVNLLLQHLLDAAAVAELIWDDYLAPAVRARIDASCQGQGRALLALLCGLHDVGKASPAFQGKVPVLAGRVHAVGLGWSGLGRDGQRWHHPLAGVVIVRRALAEAGWGPDAVDWVWPLIGGHHGCFPSKAKIGQQRMQRQLREAQGRGAWELVQDGLVRRVATELDLDLATAAPVATPTRADQLTISGLMVMADWISSDQRHFVGVSELAEVSMAAARGRAARAWGRLGIRGGWDPLRLPAGGDLVAARFGVAARPTQLDAMALAAEMPSPGLLILEAPMGEGKTEAALAAAEVLARRFGADGVFVGMPTQATSDPMFERVLRWTRAVRADPDRPLQVALLHGKRRFNRQWQRLAEQVSVTGVFDGNDEYGMPDVHGSSATGARPAGAVGELPAEWLLGHKRGLLTPFVVGTIDQLLHAATRTRHVMLRQAGLAGRVVVLDEVHAYDIYMAQFLLEALRWLGEAGVPVIVLSATLPPAMRHDLLQAYLQGATGSRDVDLSAAPEAGGYPSVLAACTVDRAAWFASRAAATWRPSIPVRAEVLEESPDDGPERVVAELRSALREGGCALVVRNTVARAQRTYQAAKEAFGADVVLLHGRLIAGERADRAERLLDLLGRPDRPDGTPRPHRLVVVATQLAEQSFDVDADLLITDLAPIDLLLQRAGRLHRHDRPVGARPESVRAPRMLVTGVRTRSDGPPSFPPGSVAVYGEHLLLRSAALVLGMVEDGLSVPADVSELVARGYGTQPLIPQSWQATAEAAESAWRDRSAMRVARARGFLLADPDAPERSTLAGLHDQSTGDLPDDDKVAAVVRDGEPSVEVVLVRRGDRGYLTLGGRPIGAQGEAVISDADLMDEVIQATLRLPARKALTEAAQAELRPLSGWTSDPWLRHARALELDELMTAQLGGHQLTYDPELGLRRKRLGPRFSER